MQSIKLILIAILLSLVFTSCEEDDITPSKDTTPFLITFTNEINLLSSHIFNTPDGAASPGPIANQGGSYSIDFNATAGSRLSFVTMLANSNDWFFAAGQNGVDLFDGAGNPVTGDITSSVRLYDAGTEEEDPATIATAADGGVNGSPDDDTSVRTEQQDVVNYLSASLSYNAGTFTLTLTKNEDGIITPGIVVIHAQDNPLFTTGEADRGNGLKLLAEAGNPGELSDYINETGSNGAPLRLAAAHTPFSPAVVYAFEGEDPLFTQGEAAIAGSGLEELAEDGNNEVIYNYLQGLGIPVARANEAGGIGPGGSFTFNLEVPAGYRLGIATMVVQSNDWFVGFNNNGGALFDASGSPINGSDESSQLYVFDAGTEVDETVGFGGNQPMRQAGPNTGNADPSTSIRRVEEIEDAQFGKGLINSTPGVVYLNDPRGGYNLASIHIQAQ